MDNIFISSDENSSDNINTNNSITETDKSSTSYIDSANESNISEVYSNMKGGGTAVIASVKKPTTKDLESGSGSAIPVSGTAIDLDKVGKDVSKFVQSTAVQNIFGTLASVVEAGAQGITQSVEDVEYMSKLLQQTNLNTLKKICQRNPNLIIDYLFSEKTVDGKGYKNVKNHPFYGELFKYIICNMAQENDYKELPENIQQWCNQKDVREIITDRTALKNISTTGVQTPQSRKEGGIQKGGDIDSSKYKKYYEKYLKYKLKYLELKYE
jgi:hypothetical protein